MDQLPILPSWCPQSLFTTHHPYSPPCNFKQPGLSGCCSSLVWQGRERLLTRLSPSQGLQSTWTLCWSQGSFCPEEIPLPSVFSVSSILFGLLSSYMLGYCWLFALFLSRLARCFTHVQGEVDSAPTYLTAIFHRYTTWRFPGRPLLIP